VPTPDETAAAAPMLVRYFEQTFPGATVAVQRMVRIPQEANGKYRFAICKVAR